MNLYRMRILNLHRATFKLLLFLAIICNSVYSQTLNQLKQKKAEIEKEITSINTLIDKTETETKTSLSNIQLTRRKIELKNKLIKQIEEEEKEIQLQINSKQTNIDSLKALSESIKNEYRRIIIFSSKNKDKTNILLLIFSSSDFNQAYKRLKFYQQLLRYKEQQVERYKFTISNLRSETEKLNENVMLLSKKQKEKLDEIKSLKNTNKTYQDKIVLLSKKKKELYADLEEQKKVSSKINFEIKRVIEEEARKAREETNLTKRTNYTNLNANFKDNIGKFSLPVEKGMITGVYGESFHPVLKGIKVKNNGIDITITTKSNVYSIFKGEVRTIFKLPGSNLALIVRHGNFLTVYANLTVVNVSVGQELQTNQKIGEIGIPKGEQSNILHFELWNESKTEDPLKWIRSN